MGRKRPFLCDRIRKSQRRHDFCMTSYVEKFAVAIFRDFEKRSLGNAW